MIEVPTSNLSDDIRSETDGRVWSGGQLERNTGQGSNGCTTPMCSLLVGCVSRRRRLTQRTKHLRIHAYIHMTECSLFAANVIVTDADPV